MENLFNFIVLVVIAYLVYRLFRHFVPPTPPAAAGANTPPPVPVNWNERIGNFLKIVAVIAIIWLVFFGGFTSIFKGGSSSETTQSVDVRDNYGVIQQNDIHVTNIIQPKKVEQVVEKNKKTEQIVTEKRTKTPKQDFKRYLDTNEDPPAISASMEKDAEIDPRKLLR